MPIDNRALVIRCRLSITLLSLLLPFAASALPLPDPATPGPMGAGHGGPGDGQRGPRPEMEMAHFLIDHHDQLQRRVETIENGVRTTTTAADPQLVEALRTHVRQMAALLEDGGRVRNWDLLFREIFDHRGAIEMEITDIASGVEVLETSSDASVARLIQAHARKVDAFVLRGRPACREQTPLPPDYSPTSP